MNPRVGIMFMIIMLSSPGMFQAATALLPSSFTMYTGMWGMSKFLDWRGGSQTNSGIMWFGIGGIVGWPFASALIAPFMLQEAILTTITQDGIEALRRVIDGVVRCLLVLVRNSTSEQEFR
jgi:alpha-1,2-mannosyltransferase